MATSQSENPSEGSPQSFFKHRIEKQLESIYPSPDADIIKITSRKPRKPAPQSVERIEWDAEPIEPKNEDIVNDHDGRIQIEMTAKWPHSVHGVVACKMNKKKKWGTGIMIGPNIVLTAGHNLYDYKLKTFAQRLQFLPGMNGQILPFGPVEVEHYFVSPNYIEQEKEDYALLLLKEPIGEMTGYFGLACLEPEEIKSKRINVTGYPGDKVASKPRTYEMWGMEGQAAYIDLHRGYIHYLIDTSAGQSGSGVWFQEGENYYVCGVHVSGGWNVNRATLLTRNAYRQIHQWLQQVSFKESLFKLKDSKELCLDACEVNVEEVSLLMEYNLDDLEDLVFTTHETVVEIEGLKTLANNTSWTNLSKLQIYRCGVYTEGAQALAQNTSWINLSELDLRGNSIGTEGVEALAQNIYWVNLTKLYLAGNAIDAEGAKIIAQNKTWVNIKQLDLSHNDINNEGAAELAENETWINLSELDLSMSRIGAGGVKALAQNKTWVNLSKLELSYNDIKDEGAKALAENTSWVDLSELSLYRNGIGAEGAEALKQNETWKKDLKLGIEKEHLY